MKREPTSDALEIMDRWHEGDPEWKQMVAEEYLNTRIGMAVYDYRKAAKLSQAKLAKMIGTSQRVISNVENADYEGSALEIFWRVLKALGKKLIIEYEIESDSKAKVA